ncbi:hypothetical protein [Streptosporangium longisporum]|uniref:hypothetical protein n=1 Tax=Streptosporangium longisporum TaxID=46187 RepID=UPI0031E91777
MSLYTHVPGKGELVRPDDRRHVRGAVRRRGRAVAAARRVGRGALEFLAGP